MDGKKPKRNPMPEWGRELLPPPGVEIQLYRRRGDDSNRWEYLGLIEPEVEIELEHLQTAHPMDLDHLAPGFPTQEVWGGGEYQFRFFWRDEDGRKKLKRTRNLSIWGRPIPRQ